VTIVAAWIEAETGVGPSMASGSQVCSGNLRGLREGADEDEDAAGHELGLVGREGLLDRAEDAQVVDRAGPVEDEVRPEHEGPTSPTTLITNALMPAPVAVVRRYQYEMSR
jgi:hypothetical protein